MRIFYLFILFAFVSASQIFSQEDLISKAKEEYSKGNFDKSIEYYNTLLSSDNYSPLLYYNLGNAYYKKSDFGTAILYYEKALKYSPNDSDIKHNLFLANRKIDSEIVELPDFFLNRWWQKLTDIFSLKLWTIISLLSALILALAIGFYWLKNYNFKGFFPLLASTLALLLVISVFASFQKEKIIYNNDKYILIRPDSLFNAPDTRSELLYKLESGEKLHLIDSINTWYKVKLANKETGWINKTNCVKI